VKDVNVREPAGFELPPIEELRAECGTACEAATGTSTVEPLVVRWTPKAAKAKAGETP
jgi:hypothetical protein